MAGFSRCWRRRDQTTHSRLGLANSIGIGFQRGTHTRWQLVANDGTGAPTLTDIGASFAIATGGVLTLFIAAPPLVRAIFRFLPKQREVTELSTGQKPQLEAKEGVK